MSEIQERAKTISGPAQCHRLLAFIAEQAEEIQRLSDELTKWRKGLNSISYDTKDAEIQNLKSKYHELLYQVEKNFPNESRHETALRYIRQAESHDNGPEKSEQPKDTGA